MFTIVVILHSIMPQNKLATAALSFFCQFLESYVCSVAGGVRVEAQVCKQVSLCRRLHDTSMPEAQVALHGAEGILMQDSGKISCAENLGKTSTVTLFDFLLQWWSSGFSEQEEQHVLFARRLQCASSGWCGHGAMMTITIGFIPTKVCYSTDRVMAKNKQVFIYPADKRCPCWGQYSFFPPIVFQFCVCVYKPFHFAPHQISWCRLHMILKAAFQWLSSNGKQMIGR